MHLFGSYDTSKDHLGRGLYVWTSDADIIGHADADWAGDVGNRRSTPGYCALIGGNMITWKGKRQNVAGSSIEASYRAMYFCG